MRIMVKEKHPLYAIAAVVMGVAFYYAWIFEYIHLSATSSTTLADIFANRIIISLAIIAVMLFAVFFARLLIPLKTRVSVPFLVLAVIGTLIGPYSYLTPVISPLLFSLGAAFVGMEFAWLSLIWSELFGLVDVHCSGYCLAMSCMTAAVVYFLMGFLPLLPACIITSVFPIVSTVMLVLGFRVLSHDGDADRKAKRFAKKPPSFSPRLPWRTSELFGLLKQALVSMGVFGFIFAGANMMVGISGYEIAGFGGLGLLLFLAMFFFSQHLTMHLVYRIAQPIMMLGLLLLATRNALGMLFACASYAMLLFLLILTLCEIANRFETPVVRLAGFAFATSLAASCAGMTAGFALNPIIAASPESLGIAVGVSIVGLATYCAFARDDGGFIFAFGDNPLPSQMKIPAGASAKRDTVDPRDMETSRIVFYEAINQRCSVLAGDFGLSSREEEVLVLIMQGSNIQEAANRLSLSQSTVKTHIHHIYVKMGIQSRAELRILANLGQ